MQINWYLLKSSCCVRYSYLKWFVRSICSNSKETQHPSINTTFSLWAIRFGWVSPFGGKSRETNKQTNKIHGDWQLHTRSLSETRSVNRSQSNLARNKGLMTLSLASLYHLGSIGSIRCVWRDVEYGQFLHLLSPALNAATALRCVHAICIIINISTHAIHRFF
jgi:hypothetical protein